MPHSKHFFIEGSPYGMISVRPSDSDEPVAAFSTVKRALEYVSYFSPDDVPEVLPPLSRPDAASPITCPGHWPHGAHGK